MVIKNNFYFIVTNKFTGVINRFNYDLTTLETCLGFTAFTVVNPVSRLLITQVLAGSRPVATIMST